MEPKTKLVVSHAEAQRIRTNVQNVRIFDGVFGRARLALPQDAPGVLELLMDKRVSDPVYTLPRPFSLHSVTEWITDHERQAKEGVGLLMLTKNTQGQVTSISDFQFGPNMRPVNLAG